MGDKKTTFHKNTITIVNIIAKFLTVIVFRVIKENKK